MSMRYQAGIVLPGYNALLVANAPTIGTATAGSSCCASITFTAPSCTGGSVISTYTAYCTTTGTKTVTGASSPLTVTGLTTGTSYTFKVIATNIYGPSYPSAASNSITAVSAGSQSYTTAGTFSWVAPSGVTSVSVVAIGGGGGGGTGGGSGGGGGGLGYKNNISVTPGNSYTVVVGVGATSCLGGDSYFISTATVKGGFGRGCGAGGSYTGDGGGNGGCSGGSNAGGGGAGGYAGKGGNGGAGGGSGNGTAGCGGAAGGGGARLYSSPNFKGAGGGGGTGILGQGCSGGGGTKGFGGSGGSGGSTGGSGSTFCFCSGSGGSGGAGGLYGGGGGAGFNCSSSRGSGARGAVRIMWPGNTRSFPSTNAGNP